MYKKLEISIFSPFESLLPFTGLGILVEVPPGHELISLSGVSTQLTPIFYSHLGKEEEDNRLPLSVLGQQAVVEKEAPVWHQ